MLQKSISLYKDHCEDTHAVLDKGINSLFQTKKDLATAKLNIMNLEKVNEKNRDSIKKLMTRLEECESETERVHKRMQKKIENEKSFAVSNFAKDLLNVIDTFDLCFENLDKNQENEKIKDSDFFEAI